MNQQPRRKHRGTVLNVSHCARDSAWMPVVPSGFVTPLLLRGTTAIRGGRGTTGMKLSARIKLFKNFSFLETFLFSIVADRLKIFIYIPC